MFNFISTVLWYVLGFAQRGERSVSNCFIGLSFAFALMRLRTVRLFHITCELTKGNFKRLHKRTNTQHTANALPSQLNEQMYTQHTYKTASREWWQASLWWLCSINVSFLKFIPSCCTSCPILFHVFVAFVVVFSVLLLFLFLRFLTFWYATFILPALWIRRDVYSLLWLHIMALFLLGLRQLQFSVSQRIHENRPSVCVCVWISNLMQNWRRKKRAFNTEEHTHNYFSTFTSISQLSANWMLLNKCEEHSTFISMKHCVIVPFAVFCFSVCLCVRFFFLAATFSEGLENTNRNKQTNKKNQ